MYISAKEREINEMRRYGLTTAFISFFLSGFAACCLLYAYLKYEEVPIVERVIKNWNDQPLLNITTAAVDQACPSGFMPMLTTEWPGTIDYCICYPSGKPVEVTPGSCSLKMDPGCQSVKGLEPMKMEILKQKRYCIQRQPRQLDYSNLPSRDIASGNCTEGYRLCGEGTTTCYPTDLTCPINEIRLIPKDRNLQGNPDESQQSAENEGQESNEQNPQDQAQSESQPEQQTQENEEDSSASEEEGQDKGIVVDESSQDDNDESEPQDSSEKEQQEKNKEQSQEASNPAEEQKKEEPKIKIRFAFDEVYDLVASNDGYGNPIVEFSWGYYFMCLKQEFYSIEQPDPNSESGSATIRRNDISKFLRDERLGCPQIDGKLGKFDSRWETLVSYSENAVYTENKIYEALDTLPDLPSNSQNGDIEQIPMHSVFFRRYVTWKPQCAIEPLRHPHRLRDENESMKQIHQQILMLTIMVGGVFVVVGVIYPSLTCCCQCCGLSTLTSYKLFLASKGVATFLLVGGFSVMMAVFIQKPYAFNSNFKNADCSDDLTNKMIWESDRSVDQAFALEALSFISLAVLLVIELVMASYYCCVKDYS